MADDILKKKVSLADLVKSASAEPDKNIGASPVPPVVFTKKVTKPVPTKTEQKAKSIVPVATTQSPGGAQPVQPQTESSEPSWLSKMFTSEPVEPGEYSTGRKVGEGVVQFLGNFGNSISGNAALNPSLNQAFAQKRQEYMDMDPNSRSSVLYRGMAQRMGLPIRGDETAFTLKEQMPNVKEFLMARQMGMRGSGGGAPKPSINPKDVAAVSTYKNSLNRDLDELHSIVDKYGTIELTGPQEQRKRQLTQQIAINYNKMLDPNSVVREGEAKQIADNLGISGWFTSNKTAKDSIRGFQSQINRFAGGKLQDLASSPEDAQALEWAQANAGNPKADAILRTLGVK